MNTLIIKIMGLNDGLPTRENIVVENQPDYGKPSTAETHNSKNISHRTIVTRS